MFYRLHAHCRLVDGAARSAIYDLAAGKVYSINQSAAHFLKACLTEDADRLLTAPEYDAAVYLRYLDRLTASGLGAFYTFEPPPPPAVPPAAPPRLEFLWLELTAACNNRCLHCYAGSGPRAETSAVSHERWLRLIEEARRAGASAVQLIGGEPLLYQDWRGLVVKAAAEQFAVIEIFTNATLIDDAMIDFFQRRRVHIATTLYAANAATHDAVTGNPGSYEKTLAAIRKLRRRDIPLRIASIIMKTNEHEAEPIMNLCRELGVEPTPPDVVRPTGRGGDPDLRPDAYVKPPIQPPFYTDAATFDAARTQHPCLAGKIAVTADGDVLPCIFARSRVVGNITAAPLQEILAAPALLACWRTTKNDVAKCSACEYRYACADCRPLAQSCDPAHDWLAPTPHCLYNPHTGQWAGEQASRPSS